METKQQVLEITIFSLFCICAGGFIDALQGINGLILFMNYIMAVIIILVVFKKI